MLYIEPSVRGLLTVFFRQQKKFFTVFGVIAVGGLLFLIGMPKVYDAHGSFLIKFGQGAVPNVSRTGAGGGGDLPSDHSELLQSNIRILQSADLLRAVVEKTGAARLYPGIDKTRDDTPEHAAVERLLAKDLSVVADTQSDVVEVHVRNKDPQAARDFADSLIAMFILRQAEVYGATQMDFLQKQVADAQKQLKDAQREFQDFKQKVGIFNLDGETTQLLAEKTSLSGFAFQAVTAAQATLSKLESDAAQSLATYRADSPIVKRLNDSIAIAKSEVQKRQADLSATSDDGSALSPKISKIEQRLAYLEQNRGAYSDMEDRVHQSEDNFKFYQQRGEEARGNELLSQFGISRISVVDKPAVPGKAVPRKRVMLLIAILMTGALFGCGVIAFFELTSDSIAYPEQVAPVLGLPVLASFSGGARA